MIKPKQSQGWGFSGGSQFFSSIGTVVDNGFFIGLTAIGTILLAFGGGLVGGYDFDKTWAAAISKFDHLKVIVFYPMLWLALGGVAFVVGSIGSYKDQKKLQSQSEALKAENSKIPVLNEAINSSQEIVEGLKSSLRKLQTELVTTHLKAAYKNLSLSTHERVSIYYEYDNEFYLLARHSQNPEYAKSHRQKFSLNQGVIGKAWQHQRHAERDCPEFQRRAEYLDYLLKTYGFKEAQALGFAMKSCRYLAFAISDADAHAGVIVFESTDPAFFESCDGQIEDIIQKYCADYQGIHSKFLRDGLNLNREVNVKRVKAILSVEEEFLGSIKGGAK